MKIRAVARNTFREMVRDKILYIALFFTVILILFGMVLSDIAIGQTDRILKDFGFAGLGLVGVFLSIVTGVNLLFKELDKRTVYIVLSKPLSRWRFMLGKYLGILSTIYFIEILMYAFFFCTLLFFKADIRTVHFQAFLMILLELSVVVALAIFFSSFTTPVLSGMFTLGAWIVGHLHAEIVEIAGLGKSFFLKSFSWVIYRLTPDLGVYDDIKERAGYDLATSWGLVGTGFAYALFYVTALLIVSSLFFDRRDFK